MTPDEFREVLIVTFGKGWLMPAAEALGVKYQKLQRMVAGTERIYPDTEAKLLDLLVRHHAAVATMAARHGRKPSWA